MDRAPTPEEGDELRRRLDEVFGDVLPDTTADEREPGERPADDEFLANRPPHHDRD